VSNWPRSACISANEKKRASAWQQREQARQGTQAEAGSTGAAKSLPCQHSLKEFEERPLGPQLTSISFVQGLDPQGSGPTSLLASEVNWIQACWKKGRRNPGWLHLIQLLSMHYLLLLGQWLCSQPIKAIVITSVQ